MTVLHELFFGAGIAHDVLIISLTVALGFALGKIKIAGVSLGITCILFAGIIFSHFGMLLDPTVLIFVREFALILFIYAVGMQVGPNFFASFKRGGLKLNLLAIFLVLSGVIVTIILQIITGVPMATMVGVMSGAVTNTPGLGAAQQAYFDITGTSFADMATSFAITYPVGVLATILGFIIVKRLFRIDPVEENRVLRSNFLEAASIKQLSFIADDPKLYNLKVGELQEKINHKFKIAGIYRKNGELVFASRKSDIFEGDKLLVEALNKDIPAIKDFVGGRIITDNSTWAMYDNTFVSTPIIVSDFKLNGKKLIDVKPERRFDVNITHIKRDDVDLITHDNFALEVGDVLIVKGSPEKIEKMTEIFGNNINHLNEPNLIHIFLGIALGVIAGSIPLLIPGIPQPVKLGLAGGPLIVSILLGSFGTKLKLITYSTKSANLILREIGIALFLACIGLDAGHAFVNTIIKGGYIWIIYAAFITVIPVVIIGAWARKIMRLNFYTIMGVISGASTNPPALAYANSAIKNKAPSMGYATVYPLAMFLRVFAAQLLIIFMV